MSITYQLPILLSSDPDNGAENKSADGSSFRITLDRPILVPKEAKYCYVEVQASEIWNTVPNILAGVNDKFYFKSGGDPVQSITIEQGLYDLSALNISLERAIENLNDPIKFPSQLFKISADNSTQKSVIEVNNTTSFGVTVDMTPNDTFRDILGFNSQILVTPSGTDQNFTGDNVAQFNTIDYFLLHSDIINRGLLFNGQYTQIVSQVLIDVPPGSLVLSRPFNIPKIPANELIGDKRNNIQVWLTDQNNNRLNTANENFSMRLVINYVI